MLKGPTDRVKDMLGGVTSRSAMSQITSSDISGEKGFYIWGDGDIMPWVKGPYYD